MIVSRYLKRRRALVDEALQQLAPELPSDEARDAEELQVEKPLSLHQNRIDSVLEILKNSGAKRVLDLGCGEGRLLRALLSEKQFERIVGVDASHRALEIAQNGCVWNSCPELKRARIELWHGALTYRDARLEGFDAAAIVEVVEHLDPNRLRAFERVVWEWARPDFGVLTTPNRDYNVRWETASGGHHASPRSPFRVDAAGIPNVGATRRALTTVTTWKFNAWPRRRELGAPSQMGVFRRRIDAA
jgi:3' terminal RNA ribose 2'-O-methyltransferase Hen1